MSSSISFKKGSSDVKSDQICNTYFFSKGEAVKSGSWLLLLFSLPSNCNTERVAVWRRLKKAGAVQIKTSTYLLPDQPTQYEQFQWLAQQIRDYGGDSTLVRAQQIEGLTNEKVTAMFNDARAKDYVALRKSIQSFIARRKKFGAEEAVVELERLTRQFREIRAVDFFDSARGHETAMLLRRAEGRRSTRRLAVLDPQQYEGKTWLTRPRPEIDRVGSAWLISRFIDRKPKFVFAPTADAVRGAIAFDMLDAEFSHHGNYCTFETLIRRFAITDKSIGKIGEMIHDADLDDAKYQRVEAVGIDRVLKGWAKEGLSDEEILRRGFQCFDALYAFLQKR
ncbi:MAG: chromate resistance protein ChrB domain-containing protein [Nitrospirota bacterium]